MSPLLVLVATDFGVSLASALAVASGYFLAYGVSQPLWGVLSDRFGRIRLMRLTLIAAAVAGLVSALAPGLGVLIAARALTGAFYGAIISTALTHLGDTVDDAQRQPALSDLMAVVAVGTAVATAVAGVFADHVGWRLVFAFPAIVALGCAVALGRSSDRRPEAAYAVASMRAVVQNRWVLLLLTLALVEGVLVLGVLTLLAPALQSRGSDATAAGLATAAFGGSVILTTRLVRPLAHRLAMPALMAIGGTAAVLGYAVVASRLTVATVALTAGLLGMTWAFLHSSLQTWATAVVPRARGTVVALFVAFLFAGSSLGTWAAGPLSRDGRWTLLFGLAAAGAVVLSVAAVVARRAFQQEQ